MELDPSALDLLPGDEETGLMPCTRITCTWVTCDVNGSVWPPTP
ncbi:ALQxL family class IV lanthipeptide [Sphaerisporangium fuscum]|nr:ALQxL family class IV lanthipeptide [Sphaerisporangium fuscum]